jgi:hypothetical protein
VVRPGPNTPGANAPGLAAPDADTVGLESPGTGPGTSPGTSPGAGSGTDGLWLGGPRSFPSPDGDGETA